MKCCVKCFKDVEIRAIIKDKNTTGNCDFCSNKNDYVYDIEKHTELTDMFEELLAVYTPYSSLPASFPGERQDLIKNILYYVWNIFSVEPSVIYKLLKVLCEKKYKESPELFDSPVGILVIEDTDYLKKNSILRTNQWSDFVEEIKRKNRFHTDFINTGILYPFLKYARKSYKKGHVFYRGRICTDASGLDKKDMGAPPELKATAGRVNPEGISMLYMADSIKTALHEIRAGVYDFVTLGTFELKDEIEIINLADIGKLSPFTTGIDATVLGVNFEHLLMISNEIAKPLRRHDSKLDYLPTQYISDFIKSKGNDGIQYISTMCPGGYNIALYDEAKCECIETSTYDVTSLVYQYDKVNYT